jgi:hypothetical protein
MTRTLNTRWKRTVAVVALILGVMAIMPKDGCNMSADPVTVRSLNCISCHG